MAGRWPQGLSPLKAGLAMVPGLAAAILSFQPAPALACRIRPAVLFFPIAAFVLASFGGGPSWPWERIS
jgi:hypothetical protein